MRFAFWLIALSACGSSARGIAHEASSQSSAAPSVQAKSALTAEAPAQPQVVLLPPGADPVSVRVEVAGDDASRRRGLMFREHMDDDAGMLFLFERSEQLTFWMRNTHIPLDMIFIEPSWRVLGVVENAEPLTDTSRSVPGHLAIRARGQRRVQSPPRPGQGDGGPLRRYCRNPNTEEGTLTMPITCFARLAHAPCCSGSLLAVGRPRAPRRNPQSKPSRPRARARTAPPRKCKSRAAQGDRLEAGGRHRGWLSRDPGAHQGRRHGRHQHQAAKGLGDHGGTDRTRPAGRRVHARDATAGLPKQGTLAAQIKTSMGSFYCDLFSDKTPNTVANFVGLARGKRKFWDADKVAWIARPYYDGTTFHRVIPGFMIQGGDHTGTGRGGIGYMIPDEMHPTLHHDRPGQLCMANRGPNTNEAQFFITEAATPHLEGSYTIFGQCEPGTLVQRISRVPQSSPDNRPLTPVVIEHIEIRRMLGGATKWMPESAKLAPLPGVPAPGRAVQVHPNGIPVK